ncbi:hypothetical protein NHG23_08600 [Aerococcaceae bacterium NML190073]|nr:hypothetical protein [Aerococcaceae bacterium NML190073]
MKVEINEKVSKVTYKTDILYYCVLGNDYCLVGVAIDYQPKGAGIDFELIKKEFNSKLEGVKATQEDLTVMIYDMVRPLVNGSLAVTTESKRSDNVYQATVVVEG